MNNTRAKNAYGVVLGEVVGCESYELFQTNLGK
jgi:hypothetical protein